MAKKENGVDKAVSDAFGDGEGEEYNSSSTIDNPPVASRDDEDESEKKNSETHPGERLFDVEFSLTLKPVGGKAAKWPLLVDEIRGTLVLERLAHALADAGNIEVIQAMLRNPMQYTRKDDGQQEGLPL